MKILRKITIGLAVVGLFIALSFSQREDATSREITTAAVMGVVSTFSIITLSTKEDYGTSKNEIKKAVVKKDRLNVVYNERFSEANYTNVINKSCDQIIHSDLREAFIRLRLHLVVLCEQPEASNINKDSFSSPGYAETLENYIITGYANDSVDGVSGITIMGSKLLQSGKVVDLKIFVPLLDEQYPYYEELSIDAAACDAEVESYLFEEKWGVRQERLDFETDEPEEAVVIEEEKPKGRGRKKRLETPAPLDATA